MRPTRSTLSIMGVQRMNMSRASAFSENAAIAKNLLFFLPILTNKFLVLVITFSRGTYGQAFVAFCIYLPSQFALENTHTRARTHVRTRAHAHRHTRTYAHMHARAHTSTN